MKSSKKTAASSTNSQDAKIQPATTAPRTQTEIADPDEFEAMKREFLSDPAARAVYLETLARFSVARLITGSIPLTRVQGFLEIVVAAIVA